MEFLFWFSFIFLVYTYAGYPVLIWLLSLVFGKRVDKREIYPAVSLLIPAYNEERVIEEKIKNSLELEYPKDKLEIIVISDGSTDDTNKIARKYMDAGVILRAFEKNVGKVNALNGSVPETKGEILIITDASSILDRNAVGELIANFNDKTVGCVTGAYVIEDTDKSKVGDEESVYWKYEMFIKLMESNLGGVLGAHGSLFVLRKKLYPFPEGNIINDDYVIPMEISKKGFRVTYEPRAVSREKAVEMEGFKRRLRIAAGDYQQLRLITDLAKNLRVRLLFQFISHKLFRLLAPWASIVLFLSSFFAGGFYRLVFFLQAVFYLTAAVGYLSRENKNLFPLIKLPYYWCMINLSFVIGLFKIKGFSARKSWGK